jgi:hypothetical protein
MPHQDAFDAVRAIGLSLPGVEAVKRYDGATVLKAGGSFMAGIASHPSAEPNSLVVRAEFDDRELLLEDAPETYYVTDYYRKYPLVLARLDQLTEEAIRDLLSVSRSLALAKSRCKQAGRQIEIEIGD